MAIPADLEEVLCCSAQETGGNWNLIWEFVLVLSGNLGSCFGGGWLGGLFILSYKGIS